MKSTSLGTIGAVLLASLTTASLITPASANESAKIEAHLGAWGRNCKNEVATKFGGDVSMADISVTVGATLQQSIDSGEMTLKDLETDGASYNWEIAKKKMAGYCNTNGKGKVTEFKIQ